MIYITRLALTGTVVEEEDSLVGDTAGVEAHNWEVAEDSQYVAVLDQDKTT